MPNRTITRLVKYFHRNGYVRRQDPERIGKDGYKKGDEIRLVAKTLAELEEMRELLLAAGFEFGQPHQKGQQQRQPIYGRAQVARFMTMVESVPPRKKKPAKKQPTKRAAKSKKA